MEKIGFTIGKFAPLHKGHQFLIEKGLSEMDKFVIVLYETDKINIDLETRKKWLQDLYPNAEVILAKNPPTQYGLDEKSVNIQMEYLSNIIGSKHPTHFYSSEQYGKYVAEFLNIENVEVDRNRDNNPISATEIRKDINLNKNWLEPIVFEDCKNYIRR